MTANLRFIEALVVQFSDSSGAFYAYSPGFANDIIIDVCYCPKVLDLVGKWIKVGIDSRNRARELVSVVVDKFSTRIEKKQVEVKVEVTHDGRTNDNLEMFKNEYFGYICDPNNLLYDIRKGVRYEIWIIRFKCDRLNCRWRVSTEQDSIKPYFQNKTSTVPTVSRMPAAEKWETVVGIVTCHAKMGNFWLAWSNSRPRSTLCLDYSFCPLNAEIHGKWVEMTINEKHRVRQPVRIISALYETRIVSKQAEFRVNFRHTKRHKQDYEMFYHQFFGNISDSAMMLGSVENGAWYNGWIVYCQIHESNSYWRLAMNQQVQGPFKHQSNSEQGSVSQENHEYNDFSRREPQHESRSIDRNYSSDYADKRSSSPDIVNIYENNVSDVPQSSRFDSVERRETESLSYSRSRRNNSPDNSHRENSFSNTNNGDRRCYYSEERRSSLKSDDNHSEDYSRFPSNTHKERPIEKELSNRMNRRLNVTDPPSNGNYSGIIENSIVQQQTRETELVNENADSRELATSKSYSRTSDAINLNKIEEIKTDKKQKFPNAIHTSPQEVKDEVIVPKTKKEKDIRVLQEELSKMSRLVLSLTSDDSVSVPMKMWSVEDYEDLMQLAKANLE